jgi:FkbM family methyltransferase
MLDFNDIKRLIRSRSWDYMKYSRGGNYADNLKFFQWKGRKVFYRAGTADAGAFYEILIRPSRHKHPNRFIRMGKNLEYWVPAEISPEVILDIGGNIGTTSVYYSKIFPLAKIFTFEPVPSNYSLLKKNTYGLENVQIFNVGLGCEEKKAMIYGCEDSNNTGGFSLFDLEVDKSNSQEVIIKEASSFLKDIGVGKVDLIKIDTEGSEYDILTSIDVETLSGVRWIIGELHGERDFELLAYLSKWFDIDVKKSLRNRLFSFNARNKNYKDKIPWKN